MKSKYGTAAAGFIPEFEKRFREVVCKIDANVAARPPNADIALRL